MEQSPKEQPGKTVQMASSEWVQPEPGIGVMLLFTTVANVGLGVGAGLLVAGSLKADKAERQWASLGGKGSCGPATAHAAQCAAIATLQNDAADYRTGGAVSLTVGSVAAASALALTLKWTLDDLRDDAPNVGLVPIVGPSTAGAAVVATF